MVTTLALNALAAPELVGVFAAVGEQVRMVVGQAFAWVGGFDARLLGCPTIIIQTH
jgi:hypothetical protein